MRYNQLGKTGMFVSEICLGAMTFGGQGFWQVVGKLDQKATTGIVSRSLEAGVNFIDTADVYSEGSLRSSSVSRSRISASNAPTS